MSQTYVRRVRPPATRSRSAPAIIIIGLILLFAAIGVVSAGMWASDHLSGTSARSTPSTNTGAAVARARTQATSIVAQANQSAQTIHRQALATAHHRSTLIIKAAEKKARTIVRQANHKASAVRKASAVSAAPTVVPVYPTPTALAPSSTAPQTTTAPPANLKGVPASWLVVAYNATFGSGPGSVGGVTVTNRGSHAFSGTVVIEYTGRRGAMGSSSAAFAGLAPGQTEVLPLSGTRYPAGATGYKILVQNVH